MYAYEVRPRKVHRGVDLISDALPFGRFCYTKRDDAVDYGKSFSRSHNAVIRAYDAAGNVIETHEHPGEFMECKVLLASRHTARVERLRPCTSALRPNRQSLSPKAETLT